MTNETTVKAATTSSDEVKEAKPKGSGEWLREQFIRGWIEPKKGLYPEQMLAHVQKNWATGKTLMNDVYFNANKVRKDNPEYKDLNIRAYRKKIEDVDGSTERKEKEKKAETVEKAKIKAEKAKKAEAQVKAKEEKKAA